MSPEVRALLQGQQLGYDPTGDGSHIASGATATDASGTPQIQPAVAPGQRALFNAWEDAQECAKCGGRKVRTGSCYTCRDCGDNSGCG